MKIILLVLLTVLSVYAKSEETCYTVQLLSKSNTKENLHSLEKQEYDKSCKIMKIGQTLTVRCGCYDEKEQATVKLKDFLQNYKNVMVSSTYRYRFDTIQKNEKSTSLEKTIFDNVIQKEKKKIKKSVKQDKAVCYTVQLTSLSNTKSNLQELESTSYPKSCKLMQIGKTATVRCGCEDKKSVIKKSFRELKELYPYAEIMRTYKYRFQTFLEEKTTNKQKPQKIKIISKKKKQTSKSQEEEELRLILQVFLYKGDLENAYIVANIGYDKNKKSYYWNQKIAEIAKWTNRSSESMFHLRNMYNIRYNKKIENELIAYGVESYQYEKIESLVINKAKNNPTEKNIDLMIYVYKQIGEPEKVVDILDEQYKKYPQKNLLLTKALSLSLEIGDLERAKKYIDILESKKPYSQKDAALISNYYYIKHDIDKAYSSLLYVDKLNISDIDDYVKYFELKSDLGWYLQDNKNAAKASEVLMKLHRARLMDYERIAYVYKESNPKLSAYASKQAYLKYKLTYLFYTYANSSINRGKYKELKQLIKEIEAENSPLSHQALFWVIKSQVYGHYKKRNSQEKALLKAIQIAPENFNIQLMLLQYYMETNNHKKLRIALLNLESNDLASSYYLPLASAYYYLHDINRASYYTQQLLHLNDPVTKMLEFRFMQAYIYQIQNNQEAFMSSMHALYDDFKAQAKESPNLLKQDKFLSNYLRAMIHIVSAEKFTKFLKKAKKYLSKSNYRDISYSFALKHNAKEKSKQIYHKIKHKELWLKFSNSLLFSNHSKIQNLLQEDLKNLSVGDASQAASADGQKALAQMIAFDGLNQNSKNQNAYIQHLELSKERSDRVDVKMAYSNRDPLTQNYLKAKNSLYLSDGYQLLNNFNYFNNKTLDSTVLFTVPNYSLDASVGIKKIYDEASLELDIYYYDILKAYYGAELTLKKDLSKEFKLTIDAKKNTMAQESISLLLGGNKDLLGANIAWQFLRSTTLDFRYEYSFYNSQDGVFIGNGEYMKVVVSQQIRNAYPDMRVSLFYDTSKYQENNLLSHGVIDKLQKSTYSVLSQDSYNLGMIFSYGMANSGGYTRVWRPFAEFMPTYNSLTDDYTYGFHVGIGGRVTQQDHLVVGASYTESIDGITGTTYEIYLKYNFFYVHPKMLKGI